MPGGDIMSPRSYWLDLFTRRTWEEFLNAGAQISGFRESRWKSVQQLRPGDYLLCYIVGISRFIGVLEVTSEAFIDHAPIWDTDEFPCRVRVKTVVNVSVRMPCRSANFWTSFQSSSTSILSPGQGICADHLQSEIGRA